MLRTLFSVLIAGALLIPGTVDVANAKSGKADKAAAKAAAKAQAKAAAKGKAKGKAKKFKKDQAAIQAEADAARDAMKASEELGKKNAARIDYIEKVAEAKTDEALKAVVKTLRDKEGERAKLVTAYYEPIAAKAPPKDEPAEEKAE